MFLESSGFLPCCLLPSFGYVCLYSHTCVHVCEGQRSTLSVSVDFLQSLSTLLLRPGLNLELTNLATVIDQSASPRDPPASSGVTGMHPYLALYVDSGD